MAKIGDYVIVFPWGRTKDGEHQPRSGTLVFSKVTEVVRHESEPDKTKYYLESIPTLKLDGFGNAQGYGYGHLAEEGRDFIVSNDVALYTEEIVRRNTN